MLLLPNETLTKKQARTRVYSAVDLGIVVKSIPDNCGRAGLGNHRVSFNPQNPAEDDALFHAAVMVVRSSNLPKVVQDDLINYMLDKYMLAADSLQNAWVDILP